MIKRLMDTVFGYNFVRKLVTFGGITKILSPYIDAKPSESIIDVGCGVGEFCEIVPGKYLGIDMNLSYIDYAKKHYSLPNRRFLKSDITKYDFKERFDKALYISVMHHLDKESNSKIFDALTKIANTVIIIELLPGKNPLQKLFCKLDRGKFIRPEKDQIKIIEKFFKIIKKEETSTKSKSSRLNVYICKPLSKKH